MSIPVVPVNVTLEAPAPAQPTPAIEEPEKTFAGVLENVARARDRQEVEEGERPEKGEGEQDSSGDAKAAAQTAAAVSERKQASDQGKSGGDSAAREGKNTAPARDHAANPTASDQPAPRPSLMQVNADLDLMLKFKDTAARSFGVYLEKAGSDGRDVALLKKEPGRDVGREDGAKAPALKTVTREPGEKAKQDAIENAVRLMEPVEGQPSLTSADDPEAVARAGSADQSTDNQRQTTTTPVQGQPSDSDPSAGVNEEAKRTGSGSRPQQAAQQPAAETTESSPGSDASPPEAGPRRIDVEMSGKMSTPLNKAGTPTSPVANAASAEATPEVDIVNQIVQRARLMTRNGQELIEIQLKPDLLGKLLMRVEVADRAMTAQLTVQSEQVKNLIESQMQSLQNALEASGIRMHRMTVQVADGQKPDMEQHDGSGRDQMPPGDQRDRNRGDDSGPDGEQSQQQAAKSRKGGNVRITI